MAAALANITLLIPAHPAIRITLTSPAEAILIRLVAVRPPITTTHLTVEAYPIRVLPPTTPADPVIHAVQDIPAHRATDDFLPPGFSKFAQRKSSLDLSCHHLYLLPFSRSPAREGRDQNADRH